MRIVLASFASLPGSIGGGEVHAFQLACALRALGHESSLLAVEKRGAATVTVRRDHLNDIPIDFLSMPDCASPYDREPKLIEWATSWLKENHVDVVHLFLFNQLLGLIPAAKTNGLALCLTALEFSYFCRRYDLMYQSTERCALDRRGEVCEQCILSSYSPQQRAVAKLARVLPASGEHRLRQVVANSVGDRLASLGQRRITQLIEHQRAHFANEIDAVITPSTVMREFYLAQGVNASKLHLIPYGSDVQTNHHNGHTSNGKIRFGYIGRIDPKKGVDVLCEAVRLLPQTLPIELNVFGPLTGGAYEQSLRELSQQDQRIKLRGKLLREEIPSAYANIDVLVVPSIWYENSPITISEALSLGRPVVCSDTAGMIDLIQHERNGLMFNAGDKHALANSLRRLVEEPELLSKLRKQVRPVETSTEVASRVAAVYESIRTGNR